MSLSRFGEDRYVYDKYFKDLKLGDGFFVELGAVDGLMVSNSHLFEVKYNFTGVLIEPDPTEFQRLQQNRPHCQNFNYAVSSKTENIQLAISKKYRSVNCILDNVTPEFREMFHRQSDLVSVPARKMSQILKEANVKYIDFLSIDVEGSEGEVLSTIDWGKTPIGVICIELLPKYNFEQKNEVCRKIMQEQGFVFDRRLEYDEIWFHPIYLADRRKNSSLKL